MQEYIKILVVDDDPFVRAMLQDILESAGHSVETAEDGTEALRIWKQAPESMDLILSDMNMEQMNGLELIRSLRKQHADVPIIILTVNDEISIAMEAIRSGATDYLLKDENIQDTILISVERVMEKDRLKKQNLQLMKDLEQKNTQLEQSNRELLDLNLQKNKFLGIAAHDLRGPIGGIMGLSEVLLEETMGELTADQAEFVSMIHSVSKGMLELLDDLLDVSVIESGKLEIQPRKNDLKKLLENRIAIIHFAADKKQIRIHADIPRIQEFPFDAKRIAQVFDNYMSNAIKFSPLHSNIYVTMTEEGSMIRVSVRDEGPGISAQDRDKLFGEFQRLSARPTGGESSTGLGLAIVKKIIDAHGGKIAVNSRQGEGSTFSFLIPRGRT
ncbi:MAG: response regulator [Desulfobacterales bacterium]